jgi:hypothetical protein
MDESTLNRIIHDMTSYGQMFHSYAQLVSNPSLRISPKKIQEIFIKCSKGCLEIRNMLIEEVKE